MNMKKDDFWKIALKINRDTKKPEYPVLFTGASEIEQYPLYGIGSNGGGYVVICDFCGKAKYTDRKTQQFCSRTCKIKFQNSDIIPKIKGDNRKYQRRSHIHKTCSFCGKKFKMYSAEVDKGKGIFCSKKCAAHARGFIPIWFKCNKCHNTFRAITKRGSLYCSNECDLHDNRFDPTSKETFTVRKPLFVEPEDKYEHMINLQLEDVLLKLKDKMELDEIIINRSLRSEVVQKTQAEDSDDYYLYDSRRKAKKMLDMI